MVSQGGGQSTLTVGQGLGTINIKLYSPILRNQMGWELSENDTVRDMMEELFPINRRDYRVRLRSGDEHNWKNASYLTDVFVSPYGLCLKMDLDFSSGLSETKVELFKISNYKIMFVYPEMLFNGFIYLNDESNSRISVERDDFESVHLYKVNLAARTHSPISTDCSTNCTQYTNCLAEYVKKITIGMLGCLPPWMEESVLTCTKTVPFNRTLFKSFEVINEDLFSSNIGSQCTKE